MKLKNSLIPPVFISLCLISSSALAASEKEVKTPLPPGLSKDAQFIIYYVDKRFDEIKREMDQRFNMLQREIDSRFELVDKRFEQIDKRFEQVDKRFEEMFTFLWILAGIFTTLTAVVIGFAYWDRRTIIRQARDEAIERIEREGRLQDFIKALRAFARKNSEFEEILRRFNLF